jgi:hypothetical protein
MEINEDGTVFSVDGGFSVNGSSIGAFVRIFPNISSSDVR